MLRKTNGLWEVQPFPQLLSHYGTFTSCIFQARSHFESSPQGSRFRKYGLFEQHHPDFPVNMPKPLRLHTRKHQVNKVYFLICDLQVLWLGNFLKNKGGGNAFFPGQILGLVCSLPYWTHEAALECGALNFRASGRKIYKASPLQILQPSDPLSLHP